MSESSLNETSVLPRCSVGHAMTTSSCRVGGPPAKKSAKRTDRLMKTFCGLTNEAQRRAKRVRCSAGLGVPTSYRGSRRTTEMSQ